MKKYQNLLTQDPKTEAEEYEMFADFYYRVLDEIHYPNLTKEVAYQLAEDCVYNDEKYDFFEDVDSELEHLLENYNLYMITDAWPSSLRVLQNRKIFRKFQNIMISSFESKTKREGLFEIFLKYHREVIPGESIFIDDRSDILDYAEQCGFHVLLMNRSQKTIESRHRMIHHLCEIESIVHSIDEGDDFEKY